MENRHDSLRKFNNNQNLAELPFRVTYSPNEVVQLAKEIREETVAEVHLSLFIWWVCESNEHFEQAKIHLRELGLDQVRIQTYV